MWKRVQVGDEEEEEEEEEEERARCRGGTQALERCAVVLAISA